MQEELLLEKPKKSLRSLLISWFLVFSLIPLISITVIYYINSEKILNVELNQRLDSNVREVDLILKDYRSALERRSQKIRDNGDLLYYLSSSDTSGLSRFSKRWLEGGIESTLSFFNTKGQMLSTVFRSQGGNLETRSGRAVGDFFLPKKVLEGFKSGEESYLLESVRGEQGSYLTYLHYAKVFNRSKRFIGYMEVVINISDQFLQKLKKRLGVEMAILDSSGDVIISSREDLFLSEDYKEQDLSGRLFDLNLGKESFGFIVNTVDWGRGDYRLLVGASKKSTEKLRKEVSGLFLLLVIVIASFLVFITLTVSRKIVEPINDLVISLQRFREKEEPFDLVVENQSEIGLLVSSFNKMSKRVAYSRKELKEKIEELEETNRSLHETRSKLVHTAKMASLGQLVAGVAHELNNPIGFIHSNMIHLKEYSQALLDLAQVKFSGDEKKEQELKEEMDFDYISEDLPRLIRSCEDGAQRVRDIVLGLRNFSRLDEAVEKKADVHKCLEDTLNLLHGEIKTRIQIHKDFVDVPEISCYPSELNQVFMNILSNAAQAIEQEGEIWLKTQVIEEGEESFLQISIRDNGKGMSEEAADKIFDPFFTTKVVGEGTGLGLSISHGIIERHGGRIEVRSQLDEGTEFLIHLPIS